MNLWGICQKFYLAAAPLFYLYEFMICIQHHDVVRSSANQVGCLRGLGATTNKSTRGSCLDTDIACQFVNLIENIPVWEYNRVGVLYLEDMNYGISNNK